MIQLRILTEREIMNEEYWLICYEYLSSLCSDHPTYREIININPVKWQLEKLYDSDHCHILKFAIPATKDDYEKYLEWFNLDD